MHDLHQLFLRRVTLGGLLLLATCASLAAPPGAAHIPTEGDQYPAGIKALPTVAGQCLACHGPNGQSDYPDWPNLAGQKASYLLQQLKDFKSGARKHPMMQPAVAPLTDADLPRLAAYFSAQTPAPPRALHSGGTKFAAPASATACMACHDNAALPVEPYLHSQKAAYLARQLHAFRDGTRKSAVMEPISKSLTAPEIDALAQYFSAQPSVSPAARK